MDYIKWTIWLRRFTILVFVTALSLLIAEKYYHAVPLVYESTAKILLAEMNQDVYNGSGYSEDEGLSISKIKIEKELLQSHKLIRKTLTSLNFETEIFRIDGAKAVELYSNSPIQFEWRTGKYCMKDKRFELVVNRDRTIEFMHGGERVKGRLGKLIHYKRCTFIVHENQSKRGSIEPLSGKYSVEVLSEWRLIEKIKKNLDVSTESDDNPIIYVSLKGNCAEKNALFVNRLSELYILNSIDRKVGNAVTTVDLIDREIATVKEQLMASENAIEQYRMSHNVINIEQEIGANLEKLATMKVQQITLRYELDQLNGLLKELSRNAKPFEEVITNYGTNTDMVSNDIVRKINQLAADKRDLLLVYTPQDPKILVLNQKINDLGTYLTESVRNAQKALQMRYNLLSSSIEYTEQVSAAVPAKEKQLAMLEREHALLQDSYMYLNKAKLEGEMSKSAKVSFNRIIQHGEIPTRPIFPNRSVLLILAGIIGVLVASAGIYAVRYVRAKIEGVESLEKRTAIPIAFTTPHIEEKATKRELEQVTFLNSAVELELKNGLTKGKVLTVTAFSERQGKNYNLLNLCKVLAKQGKRILLVDAVGDFTWMRQGELEGHVFTTGFTNINYFGIHSSEFLYYSTEEYKDELRRLKQYGDYIIINNVYLNGNPKALLFMSLASKNLVVVENGRTSLKSIDKLDALKMEFGLPALQFILNRCNYYPSPVQLICNWVNKRNAKK